MVCLISVTTAQRLNSSMPACGSPIIWKEMAFPSVLSRNLVLRKELYFSGTPKLTPEVP